MSRSVLITLLFIGCVFITRSQNSDNDIADAKKALTGFYDAAGELNIKKAKQFMSPKYAEVNNGIIVSADSLEKNIEGNKKIVRSEKGKYTRKNTFTYLKASANGNTVWLLYKVRSLIKYNADVEEIYCMETAILVKEKEAWKLELIHTTELKKFDDGDE